MSAGAGSWIDTGLRAVGLGVWLVAGAPSWTRLLATPWEVGAGHPRLWSALYVGFAVAFLSATAARRSPASRSILLLAQSLLAIGLAWLGMPHFEGALFAVVAAQIPSLVPPVAAIAWDLGQAVVLFPLVLTSHGMAGTAKAVAEYVVFALFALAVIHLRQREAAARLELSRAHATLLAMQSLLTDDARTAERRRISREVHDAIGHGLTAASLHLQLAARAGGAPAPVRAAQEAVRATLGEVRALVRIHRAEATVDLGAALRALCAGIAEPRVHLRLPSSLRALDSARAHVVFRCVQEAITNTLRHASANNLWIDVVHGAALSATVRDDGVGMEAPWRGVGIEGIRERVAEIGGTLAIETRPGAGLTLRVEVPEGEALS